jgi:adenine deaminase
MVISKQKGEIHMDTRPGKKVIAELVDVAMGRTPADIVIRGGQWVCVQSGEIIPHTDIAVKGHLIAYVGPDASHTIGSKTTIIEAEGKYLSPGLLDAHMHVESGMLTVTQFVRAVIPHGTTGMFIDPHEIANVFGLRGVRLMLDEASVQPIHVWVQVPSCVPSAPGFETPGATIGVADIAEALKWPGVIGLGEVMNFPSVLRGDEQTMASIDEAHQVGKVVSGHYASPDLGAPFHAYAAGGPEDDHEGVSLEDALMRARQGMKVILRNGSSWQDIQAQVRAVTEYNLDSRHFLLCTDDSHCETLVHEGHIDRGVRAAIAQGVPPVKAIQMATLNTAEHYGLARDIGQIAPGRFADILLVEDLPRFKPEMVMARGGIIVNKGKLLVEIPNYETPEWVTGSVHIPRKLTGGDFKLQSRASKRTNAHVIGVVENLAPTRHLVMQVPVVGGEISANIQRDLAKLAVVERHHGSGRIKVGLVHGFGFKVGCAVATTVAHDSHNLIVAGTSDNDMAFAVNTLSRLGGGQVVVRDGKVIGLVELPIAGLMSDEPADVVSRKASSVLEGFQACGCRLRNPNILLSFLALVVIPELRLSDLGLIDVNRFSFISVLDDHQAKKEK